jgi:signal peptidase II
MIYEKYGECYNHAGRFITITNIIRGTYMKKFRILLYILVLILLDQMIKLYISNSLMDKEFNVLGSFVAFYPIINGDYSWINSISNMGIGLAAHIIMNIAILLLAYPIYAFIQKKNDKDRFVDIIFAFLFAGGLCSLIDKAAWGGSLDYVWLKGFFIFDLKDLYISIFIGLTMLCLFIDYRGIRKADEKAMLKELRDYLRTRYLKH